MERQPTVLDKAVKVSIIAGALIIALSIAYYLVVFIPRKETARVEQQDKLEKAKKDCAQLTVNSVKNNTGATASDFNTFNNLCMASKGF